MILWGSQSLILSHKATQNEAQTHNRFELTLAFDIISTTFCQPNFWPENPPQNWETGSAEVLFSEQIVSFRQSVC